MDTRKTLVAAALKILEQEGDDNLDACGMRDRERNCTTLYHHFGSADGLLSAAVEEAFKQFLETKRIAKQSSDPAIALRQGWDN